MLRLPGLRSTRVAFGSRLRLLFVGYGCGLLLLHAVDTFCHLPTVDLPVLQLLFYPRHLTFTGYTVLFFCRSSLITFTFYRLYLHSPLLRYRLHVPVTGLPAFYRIPYALHYAFGYAHPGSRLFAPLYDVYGLRTITTHTFPFGCAFTFPAVGFVLLVYVPG